jgi:hypothetical protein
LSDSLIGVDLAGHGHLPGPPIWVMLTYALGQALVTVGVVRATTARAVPAEAALPVAA